jgi:hypothetical protein
MRATQKSFLPYPEHLRTTGPDEAQRGDPARDIAASQNICFVMKGGTIIRHEQDTTNG